jgi:hypothetical protein
MLHLFGMKQQAYGGALVLVNMGLPSYILPIMGKSIYDADAQAFITAAGITDAIQKRAITVFVLALKSASIWTKFVAIYPMVGGTATTHKYNLKNPLDTNAAFRLSFLGGWTHSSTGALPGINGYADTHIIPSVSLSPNSAHLSYYSRTNSAVTNEIPMGVTLPLGGTGLNLVIRRNTDVNSFRATEITLFTGLVNSTSTDSRGLTSGSITASNSRKIYKNGALLATNSSTINWQRSTGKIFLGAANESGTANYFTDKECAFAGTASGLSDAEESSLYTAVQAMQTSLSRNV